MGVFSACDHKMEEALTLLLSQSMSYHAFGDDKKLMNQSYLQDSPIGVPEEDKNKVFLSENNNKYADKYVADKVSGLVSNILN